ncbi:2-hydroxyacylsphingosine 1-beta-galactosyltransferase-like [Asterias rubens]|uniref:2-hydroxyacylsphingosine 1-beta-galactosyltransferase-like n=1 Tax=Asterias rubens TaxID=7604 RepID=UPI0014558A48|nr:2-hydroxyacylsphingosine 1-beta-galactosyltransferase-like [Asterias rubens]
MPQHRNTLRIHTGPFRARGAGRIYNGRGLHGLLGPLVNEACLLIGQMKDVAVPVPPKVKPGTICRHHFMTISQSAKVLARLGHHVTFLSSNDAPKWQQADDADLFSHVVFKSRYTQNDVNNAAQELSRTTLRGESRNGFFIFNTIYDSVVYGNPSIVDVFLGQCDDLLSDDLVIAKLRSEEFDMLVGDSSNLCNSILAQKLNIPFVLCSSLPSIPAENRLYYGVPADPSYIPEYTTRYTDKMTFFQRVHNVLSYGMMDFLLRQYLEMYYPLKVKHNIKPEMSMLDSQRQAEIMFVNGNYPLETARPLNPNIIFTNPVVGLPSNQVQCQ